jgi:hypothetical protein
MTTSAEKKAAHTPGPWEHVPGTEHHGPYVCGPFGNTVCDCYAMSRPPLFSGESPSPISHMHEMAEPNARLIAAAPDLLEACRDLLKMVEAAHRQLGMWTGDNPRILTARAAIAKARWE